MRGKLRTVNSVSSSTRITPAGAGKTYVFAAASVSPQDHPRRCGENALAAASANKSSGSPPQVRGKLPPYSQIGQLDRITPAGAGKTRHSLPRKAEHKDHPRRCGENLPLTLRRHGTAGSPPQVRGKRADADRVHGQRRITPAGAGKTTPQKRRKGTRGRITPAGAGKTLLLLLKLSACRDHPRRCGENVSLQVGSLAERGSPPQVRGKLFTSFILFAFLGITPAGAGKTRLQQTVYYSM